MIEAFSFLRRQYESILLFVRIEKVFGKEEGVISDHERTRAKVVCLGIIYGASKLLRGSNEGVLVLL